MPFSHLMGEYWFHQLAPYLNAKEYKRNPEQYIEGVMEVSFCPMTKRQQRTEASYYGKAYQTWKFLGGEGSYGLNLWLQPSDPIYRKDLPGRRRTSSRNAPMPTARYPCWRFRLGWGGPAQTTGSRRSDRWTRLSRLSARRGYFMSPFCIDRHRWRSISAWTPTRRCYEGLWAMAPDLRPETPSSHCRESRSNQGRRPFLRARPGGRRIAASRPETAGSWHRQGFPLDGPPASLVGRRALDANRGLLSSCRAALAGTHQ
jgi:hypothetical protein